METKLNYQFQKKNVREYGSLESRFKLFYLNCNERAVFKKSFLYYLAKFITKFPVMNQVPGFDS